VFVAGGRAVSEPYYSQCAQCLRFSERFFHFICFTFMANRFDYISDLCLAELSLGEYDKKDGLMRAH